MWDLKSDETVNEDKFPEISDKTKIYFMPRETLFGD